MEKIMEPFGLRLKELRRHRNITQVEMAELLGCTDRHYQKIEYGYVNVSPPTTCWAAANPLLRKRSNPLWISFV